MPTDEQLAADVRTKIDELNAAILSAANAEIEVEIDFHSGQVPDGVEYPILSAERIGRVIEL